MNKRIVGNADIDKASLANIALNKIINASNRFNDIKILMTAPSIGIIIMTIATNINNPSMISPGFM
jgi:hypothetical protein